MWGEHSLCVGIEWKVSVQLDDWEDAFCKHHEDVKRLLIAHVTGQSAGLITSVIALYNGKKPIVVERPRNFALFRKESLWLDWLRLPSFSSNSRSEQ